MSRERPLTDEERRRREGAARLAREAQAAAGKRPVGDIGNGERFRAHDAGDDVRAAQKAIAEVTGARPPGPANRVAAGYWPESKPEHVKRPIPSGRADSPRAARWTTLYGFALQGALAAPIAARSDNYDPGAIAEDFADRALEAHDRRFT